MESFKEFTEALTMQQRLARGRIAKRTAKKRARMAKRKRMRIKGPQDMLKKAGMMARGKLAMKLSGGVPMNQLTMSQKVQLAKKLDKKKAAIAKLTKKLLPHAKKAERERIAALRSGDKIMSNDGSNITTSTTGQISMRNFIDEVQTISTPTTTVGMKQFGDKQWFIDFDRDQGAPGKSNSIVLTKHNAMTIGVDDLVGNASENNPDNWSAAPYGLQEFTSFDQANPFIFGTSNTANTNSTQTGSLMSVNSITTGSCFAFLRVSLSVWCMRVGSDLVWYMTGGRFAGTMTHKEYIHWYYSFE